MVATGPHCEQRSISPAKCEIQKPFVRAVIAANILGYGCFLQASDGENNVLLTDMKKMGKDLMGALQRMSVEFPIVEGARARRHRSLLSFMGQSRLWAVRSPSMAIAFGIIPGIGTNESRPRPSSNVEDIVPKCSLY